METLQNFDTNEGRPNSKEKMNDAIGKETDRLFSILESPNIKTEDLHLLVDNLASNPLFRSELDNFQEHNSSRLEDMLRYNMTVEKPENNPLDYFGVKKEFESLNNEFDSIGLDLNLLLSDYQNFIQNNLKGLPIEHIEKVKLSITNKLKQIGDIISDLKEYEQDKYGNLNRFSENRWIINGKIQEQLSFINSKLLPSLEVYLKIKGGIKLDSKFTEKKLNTRHRNTNKGYININYHIEEIEELLSANVDENGDFDEGFFSTQNLFDASNPKHAKMLASLGIQPKEISLLNEKDKKIEEKATLYFMAMIGVQIGVETLGGVVGTIMGGGVDVYDTFSREETLLKISQSLGLVSKEFRMDKTWVDNILAGLGLIPGGTQIIKGSRLADFMKKVDSKDFKRATDEIKEALGIGNTFLKEDILRFEKSEKLLGRKLTNKQKEAIIQAHNLGNKNEKGIYSIGDLKEKYKILQESDFTKEEIRLLLDKGICGNEINKIAGSAYDRYSYLSAYRDVLGENLTIDDIVGVGTQAIIIKHPTDPSLVIKIAQPGEKDDIAQEFHNHNKFYEIWEDAYINGDISDKIKVPKIIKGEKNGLFYIEKVEGQSLYSKTLLDRYKGTLKNEKPQYLESLTDQQVRELLKIKYNVSDMFLDMTIEDYSLSYLLDLMGEGYRNRGPTDLSRAIDYFKEQGIYHKDLHPGNVMIDRKGNIYLIDFGRVKFY